MTTVLLMAIMQPRKNASTSDHPKASPVAYPIITIDTMTSGPLTEATRPVFRSFDRLNVNPKVNMMMMIASSAMASMTSRFCIVGR